MFRICIHEYNGSEIAMNVAWMLQPRVCSASNNKPFGQVNMKCVSFNCTDPPVPFIKRISRMLAADIKFTPSDKIDFHIRLPGWYLSTSKAGSLVKVQMR